MNIVRGVLHFEGVVIFLVATWAYFALVDGPWPAYLLLLLAPDLSMVGYLRGPRLGAWTYNLVHTEALALTGIAVGIALDQRSVLLAGLVLSAHIGMDRAAGYGLKFPTHFKDTHLQRLT